MALLADRLGWASAEGDDFHPPANVEKMRAGIPLTDADRWPWLRAIAAWIGRREEGAENAIVTCSALRRPYRDVLRRDHRSVMFVHLVAPRSILESRMAGRRGHFMPGDLLQPQLEALEPLAGEPGVTVDATAPPDRVADRILDLLGHTREDRGNAAG